MAPKNPEATCKDKTCRCSAHPENCCKPKEGKK